MREKVKGKKTYVFAVLAVALGVWGIASGDMTQTEGITYILNGGALGAIRGAIG